MLLIFMTFQPLSGHRTTLAATNGTLTLTPASGPAGTLVSATGSVGSSLALSSGVLKWDRSLIVATFSTRADGTFSATFTVPASSPGAHYVYAMFGIAAKAKSIYSVVSATATPTALPTGTPVPTATLVSTPTSTPTRIATGILEPGGALFTTQAQSGLANASIELNWGAAEPANGSFSSSYFQSVENTIANARAAGLTPVLSFGLQYPASWVFTLDPNSRFVDQYGDTWTDTASSGQNVANAVWSQAVRHAEATYVQYVFSQLGTDFAAVRWGGGLPYDEVRYPGCPSGRSNCYWAFDGNAKAVNPVPGYIPGSGSPSQAQAFSDFYQNSIRDYIAWGLGVIRQSYAGEIDVLLPSWGVRPNDLSTAVAANLNGTTVRTSEITAGLDWQRQLPAYAGYGNVVAWCTWLNRGDDATDVASWGPAHYIWSLLPQGMGFGGENTYGKATASDLNDTFTHARQYAARRVMWMDEALTQQTGNATIQQVGQAASG